jgi:hypothetical protein
VPIDVTGSASFREIVAFFDRLAAGKRAIQVARLRLERFAARRVSETPHCGSQRIDLICGM